MSDKKNGFNLAEILIAVGLIGVISAIMLPTLIHRRPNENKAMFRKANYIIERISTEMKMDDDTFPSEEVPDKVFAFYDPSIDPTGPDTNSDGELIRKQKNTGKFFCEQFASKINTEGDVDCVSSKTYLVKGAKDNVAFAEGDQSFKSSDGIYWFFSPNIICDPTSPNETSETCPLEGINGVAANTDPVCPDDISVKRPFVCIWFDVNGPEGPNRRIGLQPKAANSDMGPDWVRDADRGWIYVYWNGKVKAPRGQTFEYLKSVTVF